jgi:transcriptional regulator GlxA family with amidase domain
MASYHGPAALSAISCQPTNRTYQDLVDQAEALALADLDEPLHISGLCRALAVSERRLRKAFHNRYDLPPCRHLRMLRLSQARSALLSADRRCATVTKIATSFGFVELGRFSVEYRKTFGESPSQTLQRGQVGQKSKHPPSIRPAATMPCKVNRPPHRSGFDATAADVSQCGPILHSDG